MLRQAALVTLGWLFLSGCGPDKARCSGPHPNFVVVVKLSNHPLPPDTVVRVIYGGSGTEDYSLAAPGNQEVLFCLAADASGVPLDASAATVGAAGEGNSEPVQALSCQLWTGGYSKLEVRATGVEPAFKELSPREGECTVKDTVLLEPPDAG